MRGGGGVPAYKTDATPLHWAVKGDGNDDDRKKMAALLLYYGADPSARNRDGAAPLDLAESGADADLLRAAGGVCYVRADESCGLRFLPGPAESFSVTVSDGFSGELWAVTVGTAAESPEVSYRLFSEDSRLTASGLLGADQVLRVSSERPLLKGESLSASVALWAGLQTLSASLAVIALAEAEADFMLSAHRSEVTAAAEYAGVLATLSATEEGVTVFYRSGLDAGFTLAALPSGKAALSLVSSLGAEGAVVTAEVELGKHGYFRTTVTALVTVSALLPTERVFTILSNNGDTGVRLSAMHEGTRYEKIGGPAGLSVSDSGEIFATEPGLSNFVWHHLKARVDSPGILGGERFSMSLLAAPCAPGDPPAGDLNLIAAVNNQGIDSDGVCRMILAGANVKVKNSNKATPLHRAVVRNDYAIASLLIDAGAEVDAQNTKGKTPLYLAASLERADMVLLFLSAGADGGLPDEEGITPLDMAVENDLDVVADIRNAGGVCLTRTDAACGLVMRPLHSTVVVAENHVGAALTVTAVTHGDAAPEYSLVYDVNGFSVSEAGELTADSGTLAEGLVATVSIQATTEGGTQSVAVERVVSVSAPSLMIMLSDYPSEVTAAADYAGALATLSATEEGATVFYRSGLDEARFALATLSSGKAELSLISPLGGENAVAKAVVELGKYGHVSVMVTALVTVSGLLPAEGVFTILSDRADTGVTLAARRGGTRYEKTGGSDELSVSDSGVISVAEGARLSNFIWYDLKARADSPGIWGGEPFSMSLLAAPCAPGDPPAGDLNLIAAVNNRGIDSDGVCRMILAGADVNVKNSREATPLHRAVVGDDYTVASLLIEAGAEVDAQNIKGKTPLYLAVARLAASLGRADIVSLLLSAGADGGLPDEGGITPLDMAVENDLDVVADIRAAGGVCLTRTDAACGLIMRPLHSTVVVGENHVGAALAVTATTHGDASPVYSLVDEVAGFSFDSGTLTADSGTLAEGLVATVSIQATTEGGAQTVAVERVVSVSAPTLAGVLSDYPSRLMVAEGYTGALATLSATEEGVTVFYRSELNEERFALATLSSGKAELSLISRLGGGETLAATAVLELGKYGHVSVMVTALVTVAALGPFDPEEIQEIEADHLGTIHQFTLSGYESASFSAAEGSSSDFEVSPNGAVSRKEGVILEGETRYAVTVQAEDEGFLGAVSLTLSVSVYRKEARAEFSAARYRVAMAGGYEGAVLTLSAADERVSLSYSGGLGEGSKFSLVSLSSGDYALSLGATVSGPDVAVLEPSFEFHRTGFPTVTATADIQVTILGPYSHSEVIQHNAASVAYRFAVPGFAGGDI